jgi:glucose-1-phosphate thymidylyltransferase
MKALILAAGYATRLYPITKEYPKALLKVRNRPIIDYIFSKLEAIAAIDEIVVVTNAKFFPDFKVWQSASCKKKRLSIVNDLTRGNDTRLGAVGDIDFVLRKKRMKEDLLVVGGDNLFDGDLSEFICAASSNRDYPHIGVYDIKDIASASSYGVIKLDKKNRVIDFKEKPARPNSTLVAMCLYYFPKEKLGLIGEYLAQKGNKSDATGFYIDWLRKKCQVYGFVFKGRWFDIGDHKFYNKAKVSFGRI